MIRVLLADDHAIVIEGLRALLDGEPDIEVAAWTTDGTEVVKLVEEHKPDVVVLDLELTTIKGTEVIAASRDRTPPPKVHVINAYNDGESPGSALDAGALVAGGLTNPQIAERLGLSDNTVKFHVQHLFSKLGVKNRTEAALKYAHGR